MAATGQTVWVKQEGDLDAVTAVSGSGPAYVFYFMEAMMAAGEKLGLSAAAAKQLTLATFAGATHLATASPESPATLRERVTSKGGTTYAALSTMQEANLAGIIDAATTEGHFVYPLPAQGFIAGKNIILYIITVLCNQVDDTLYWPSGFISRPKPGNRNKNFLQNWK